MRNSYEKAGVNVEAGYEAVELMKRHVNSTKTKGVLSGLGGFGGLFATDFSGMEQPVLVSGTDGVGTKLKLAFLLDKHDTIGIDCVAMCVNDLLCCGAKPLFFLDYIAISKLVPSKAEQIVKGLATGCKQAGAALVGGETAEMPGFYEDGEYDVAGFAVGVVDKPKMLSKKMIKNGDVLLALPSSGVHSNGFSLVRKVFDVENSDLGEMLPGTKKTIGEALITPTKIYVKPVTALFENDVEVHGISHITGGGFFENIPRMLPPTKSAYIERKAVKTLKIFAEIAKRGEIAPDEMFGIFNMGVGMVVAVAKKDTEKALELLRSKGEKAYVLGTIKSGKGTVELI